MCINIDTFKTQSLVVNERQYVYHRQPPHGFLLSKYTDVYVSIRTHEHTSGPRALTCCI